MGSTEKFCLWWNDFESNIRYTLIHYLFNISNWNLITHLQIGNKCSHTFISSRDSVPVQCAYSPVTLFCQFEFLPTSLIKILMFVLLLKEYCALVVLGWSDPRLRAWAHLFRNPFTFQLHLWQSTHGGCWWYEWCYNIPLYNNTHMGEISQGVQSMNFMSYFLYFWAPI